ncbi:MAG: HEPN domain-containing protein [Thermanaeromonas sp.]|uniref:HEPN domain-containing protein n=1 Tax=Thermanaeromonas sp. TaxID=2003697 RepID=UPI00243E3B95|nr:HEPN domain-containing protein [Thermanaeromonas sp.]MCG0278678.1 HEPN domain-containing protein [Thermanaeromonas sp.]
MPERSRDWMRQAEADLKHARNSMAWGDYEWSCFSAQQAAEKAVKALFQKLHLEAWGHTVSILLANLPTEISVPRSLIDKAKILDKHYILSRYPNGFDSGAPTDFYTLEEAKTAIAIAGEIIEFCKDHLK